MLDKKIKPDAIFNKITDIKPEFLKENNIKGIILDVDNTLITLDGDKLDGIDGWVKIMKKNNFKIYIASNSLKYKTLKKLASELKLDFTFWSLKPLKRGLIQGKKYLNLPSNEIAEIGDQLFTDVIGSKRMKMFSILTKPISPEKTMFGKLKRKLEKKLLNKYSY